MAAVLLLARPLALLAQNIVTNQVINPGFTNMIRWQSHWHVVRQSWTFFQNDFAGRIANRVMQTGPALRESVVAATNAVWYILVYGTSGHALLARDRLASGAADAVLVCRLCAAAARLRAAHARPLARRLGGALDLTGRVVDSYTNILTVKLFARARDEDDFVREAIDEHTDAFRRQTRMVTALQPDAGADERGAAGRHRRRRRCWLCSQGRVARRRGGDRAAAGLADRQHGRLGGAERHRDLRERRRGAGRHALDRGARGRCPTAPDAGELRVPRGEIRFEDVHFDYGRSRPRMGGVLHGIDADHRAGRARRPGRALRRRQVDAGQPAAALLRRWSTAAS